MFNEMMMNPEMMRIAQEQMSRMSPEELANLQQQFFSNPDLLKTASEAMKNMRPEDIRAAAEQMNRAGPEEIASVSADLQYDRAETLTQHGNRLHSRGKFPEAVQKYLLAKDNLKSAAPDNPTTSSKFAALQIRCSLNLMSCYLKTEQFEECVEEGSWVLERDSMNLKALYRRGQAFKKLGKLEEAVSDLKKAHESCPDDETIADALTEATERLSVEGIDQNLLKGLDIEEIVDGQEQPTTTSDFEPVVHTFTHPENEDNTCDEAEAAVSECGRSAVQREVFQDCKDFFEPVGLQDCISESTPESLETSGVSGVPLEKVNTAAGLATKMKPDDLQSMMQVLSSLNATNPVPFSSAGTDIRAERTPTSTLRSSSSSVHDFAQQTMRNAMNDPSMRHMLSSMIQSMSPETMAGMSQQFGVNLSVEDAAHAQQALSSLSPDTLHRMLQWSDRLHTGVQTAKKAKNWLLERQGMILAIGMLILAAFLHWFGFIG